MVWSLRFLVFCGLGLPSLSHAASFTDQAAALGVDVTGAKGGLTIADFNEDGYGDILANTTDAVQRTRLLFSDGLGTGWTDVTAANANGLLVNVTGRSAIAADFTNDGHVDLVVNESNRVDFYINNGPGAGFTFGVAGNPNYTINAGVAGAGINFEGLAWIDYDNDGWLDIFTDWSMRVLHNPADGTANFTIVTGGLGLNNNANTSDYVAVGDYDGDGFTDVVARIDGTGAGDRDIYHSDGDGTFTAETSFNLLAPNGAKGGSLFCDINGDGDQDLYWSHGSNPGGTNSDANMFYTFAGGNFTNSQEPAQNRNEPIDGADCSDIDNDGDLDLFVTDSGIDYMWINDGSGSFSQVNGGINHVRNGEATTLFDADLDGDLDVYVNQATANALWINDTDDDNYLQVRILADVGGCPGARVLRDDIGATADFGGPLDEVNGGQGHGGQGWHILHFGLPAGPDAASILSIDFKFGSEPQALLPITPSALGPRQYLEVIHDDPDADGVLTADEVADGNGLPGGANSDPDGDGVDSAYDDDSDGDGFLDSAEAGDADRCTSATDTDGDGAPDYLDTDSDDDGLTDDDEFNIHGTDPYDADVDADGLNDGDEIAAGTDPSNPDSDADGLNDGDEIAAGTDPLDPDTDGDGMGDLTDCDPLDPLVTGLTWYRDQDGDGQGDIDDALAQCPQPPGYVSNSTDCDDADPTAFEGALEVEADGTDSDCDGLEICYVDIDLDTYGDLLGTTVFSADLTCLTSGLSTSEDDCDDGDPTINPGAVELVADGVDQDCDTDELCYSDQDGDGFAGAVLIVSDDLDCTDPNESDANEDCDDVDPLVFPGATEIAADGVDQNCDNLELCHDDGDGDGYGNALGLLTPSPDFTCMSGSVSPNQGDCNDANPFINPLATEVPADLIDQNCDGDEICYLDGDSDGFGTALTVDSIGDISCAESGESTLTTDCDDSDGSIYPGAVEGIADGVDSDCDTQELCYEDLDLDGAGGLGTVVSADLSCTGIGEAPLSDDCNEFDPTINPYAVELPADNVDQDCDGEELCHQDVDGDTYGNPNIILSPNPFCGDPGESFNTLDCDDSDPFAYPGSPEVTDDGVDQDCNGFDRVTCYDDADDDDAGNPTPVLQDDGSCDKPFIADNPDDCDDSDPTIFPGAPEVPNDNIDQDCDNNDLVGCFEDLDLDGFGSAVVIGAPDGDCDDPGESVVQSDCDDGDDTIYPGAPEICGDGIDQDCDTYGGPDGDDDFDGLTWLDEQVLGTSDCDSDSDGDGVDDNVEVFLTMDPANTDSDGDGAMDGLEVGIDPANPMDTDGDGIIDALDTDDDGDGLLTTYEDYDGSGDPNNDDTDGDGIPDYIDTDDDGDMLLTTDEDLDGDGDPTNDDFDGDGIVDYLDLDDENDGVPTLDEVLAGADPYGIDSDFDTIPDVLEWNGDPYNPMDTDGDGIPDMMDQDDDGDGIPTFDEGTQDLDCDLDLYPAGDGIPNYLDDDSDGDGLTDLYEGVGDSDGDGIPNYVDCDNSGCAGDSDSDGIGNCDEDDLGTDPQNADTDGDGVPDGIEVGDPANPNDTDGDGIIDALDDDDDGDGLLTADELANGDTDGDGDEDYIDDDDDGDGVPTADEDRNGNGDWTDDDLDEDGLPDWLDGNETDGPAGDADGDGLTNGEEAAYGTDPLLRDTDGDGLLDGEELDDSDGDGLLDALDDDDDDDGIPTAEEGFADSDGDGIPNYLDDDSDDDGFSDAEEGLDDDDCDTIANYVDADDQDGPCAADSGLSGGTIKYEGCSCETTSGANWLSLLILGAIGFKRRRDAAERGMLPYSKWKTP